MPKYFLLTVLLCSSLCTAGWSQNTDFLVERLHRQVEKAQQMEGRYLAWQLARFGHTYVAPGHPAMQRLYYETYYLPEEVFYEEGEDMGEDGFNASDWSPDGKQLAVATSNGYVRFYPTSDFSTYQTLECEGGGVLDLAYSPDGQWLAYGGVSGQVYVAEVSSGSVQHEWKTEDYIRAVAWSPDGKFLAAGGDENNIYVYSLGNSEPVYVFTAHTDWVRGLSFSKDGKMLAAASDDATATVWSVESGVLLRVHRDHEDYCRDVVFNPDGEGLLTVSDDLRAYLYRPGDASEAASSWKLHQNWIMTADWSDNGRMMATADQGGTIIVNDLRRDKQEYLNSVDTETAWIDVDFSPDSRSIAATAYNEIAIYELGQSAPIHRLDLLEGQVAEDSESSLDEVLAAVLSGAIQIYPSPDGSKLAIIDADWDVQVVDLEAKQVSYLILDHEDWIRDVSWSQDGRYIATASDDMLVGVWDANDGSMQHLLSGHSDWVRGVAFSPDSKVLLSAGDDGVVRAWDPVAGTELAVTDALSVYLLTVSWSPNQAYFAATDAENYLHVYSARNNELVASSETPIIPSTLQWTGDEALVVTDGANNSRIAWAPSGFKLAEFTSGTLSATSKSGAKAMAKENYIILEKPQALLLEGHSSYLTALEWTPDGSYLISQAANGELGIWSNRQRSPLAILNLPEATASKYLVWREDGSFFVPGLSKAVVLPPSTFELPAAELDFSPEILQLYGIFDIVQADEAVLGRVIAGEDDGLKGMLAAIYEKRASLNPDAAAAAKDRSAAERLRAGQ